MKLKSLSKVIIATFCGVSLFGNPAEARIALHCIPMLTYANATVPTYDKPGGDQKGYISPNVSLILIKELRKDGWAYGSYPIAGGKRIYRYFRMTDVQGYSNFENYPVMFDSNQTVYRAVTGDAIVGTLPAGVEGLVVGESGNNLKIIYKVSGGNEYKMGWVSTPAQEGNSENSETPENNIGGALGNFKGNIVIVKGDVVNSGSINASTNDSSVTDNSYNDNSRHNTTINEDNSYTDARKNTNVNVTDNSKNTTNVDSFNNASFNSDNPNAETNRRRKSGGDLNNDGKVNFEDLLLLAKHLKGKAQLSSKKADINRDGQVNKADFDALLKIVKQKGNPTGDLNNDGKIDAKDLEIIKQYVKENKSVADAKNANLKANGQTITTEDISKLQELLDLLK